MSALDFHISYTKEYYSLFHEGNSQTQVNFKTDGFDLGIVLCRLL